MHEAQFISLSTHLFFFFFFCARNHCLDGQAGMPHQAQKKKKLKTQKGTEIRREN
jgi:hypothetical protein